jgi:hypothetical protein
VTKSRQEFYQIGFFHKSSTGGSHRSASDEEKHSRSFLDRERGTSGPYVRIWKEEGQHSVFEHLEIDNLSELDRVRKGKKETTARR